MSEASFQLPALAIEAKGEVISSNASEFHMLVKVALSGINRDLKADEDFGQAELDVKGLKAAEDAVRSAKDKALSDAESLHSLFSLLDETSEEIRSARVDLENQIKKRKEEVKGEIVEEYLAQFVALGIDERDARRTYLGGLQSAIKGKRTLDSMRTSCGQYAGSMLENIKAVKSVLDKFEFKFGTTMTPDRRELEMKDPDWVGDEMLRRIEAKKQAEEKAKLQAEAKAAQAEADKAKADLAAASKRASAPEKIAEDGPWDAKKSEPVAKSDDRFPADIDAEEELKAFKDACKAAFGSLKVAKEALKHPGNIKRAAAFGDAINAAWSILNAKGGEA